jgi:hypothetical protein
MHDHLEEDFTHGNIGQSHLADASLQALLWIKYLKKIYIMF